MIPETDGKPQNNTAKPHNSATVPKTMRMLSAAQAHNPMKTGFHGGFMNVSFQVGVVDYDDDTPPNQIYLRKTKDKPNPLPILLPNGTRRPPKNTLTKITCSVLGGTDPATGANYPILVGRHFEVPNVLEAKTRRVTELLEKQADPYEMLIKQTKNGNEVHLTGVCVKHSIMARRRRDGTISDDKCIVFGLRQDSDKDHIIPVICDRSLAMSAKKNIRFGDIMTVKGEFHVSVVPIYQVDETGKNKLDGAGAPIPELDEKGKVKVRYMPYIHLHGYPGVALNEHILFSDPTKMPVPAWIVDDIAQEIDLRSQMAVRRSATQTERQEEDSTPQVPSSQASLSTSQYVATGSSLAEGL